MNDGRLLVVCKDDRSLEVLDLASATTVGRVYASGVAPHEVVATADGRLAYLPVYGDSPVGSPGTDGRRVDVVDLHAFQRVGQVDLDIPSRPHQASLLSDGRLLVSTELDDSVTVIDARALRVLGRTPTGEAESHTFAVTADGGRLVTANVGPGTVSILDLRSRSLVAVVEVSERVNRICLSPDGRFAYTADQTSARLAVIDTHFSERVGWIELPSVGFGTAVSADGSLLVVALRAASEIAVIDRRTGAVVRRIATPEHPQAVVLHPDGVRAYSACDAENCVVEVDVRAGRLLRRIDTGRNPDGLAWAPLPRSVLEEHRRDDETARPQRLRPRVY